jgi:hypothetical protein
MQGIIDDTHVLITKFVIPSLEDYYYHKSKCYSMVAQVVIDSNDYYLMFSLVCHKMSMTPHILRSRLYQQFQYNGVFDPSKGNGNRIPLYFLGEKIKFIPYQLDHDTIQKSWPP